MGSKIIILLVILLNFICFRAFAIEENYIHLEKINSSKTENVRIVTFAVDNTENVYIGFEDKIDVITSNGEYLFSYIFNISGAYAFHLIDERLAIIDVRNQLLSMYEKNGDYIYTKNESDAIEIYKEWSSIEVIKTKNVYEIYKEPGKYTIIKKEEDLAKIIYQSSPLYQKVNKTKVILLYLIPPTFLLISTVWLMKKRKNGKNTL